MKRALLLMMMAGLCVQAADTEKGFKPIFDGKTLKGWDGDPRLWSVKDGELIGSTEGNKLTSNTFLIYKAATFGDFILRAKVKLRNHNSGIQFRSEELPNWVMKGYQADMAEGNWWGSIYEEKGKRGVMVNGWKGKGETVVKPTDWNDIEIYCKGEEIRITLNGLVTAELKDSLKLDGLVGLQLHQGPPMEVRFKDIRVQTLK
jgi:Domain of Unknown Function (DUF1080)